MAPRDVAVDVDAAPDSYSSGGVTINISHEQAQAAQATVDNTDYVATVTGVANSNEVTVALHNVDDGTEVGDGTDISGDEVTLVSYY